MLDKLVILIFDPCGGYTPSKKVNSAGGGGGGGGSLLGTGGDVQAMIGLRAKTATDRLRGLTAQNPVTPLG